MTTDVNSVLMGAGGRSASFKKHDDQVWGTVMAYELRQQHDIATGEPLTWPDGNPKNQIVITLLTEESEDDEDDGLRRVYVKVPSQLLTAMRQAVTKAGAKGIDEGGKFLVRYTGDAEPKQRGFNGQKLYFCKYEKPAYTNVLPEPEWSGEEPDAIDPDNLPF